MAYENSGHSSCHKIIRGNLGSSGTIQERLELRQTINRNMGLCDGTMQRSLSLHSAILNFNVVNDLISISHWKFYRLLYLDCAPPIVVYPALQPPDLESIDVAILSWLLCETSQSAHAIRYRRLKRHGEFRDGFFGCLTMVGGQP